MTYQAIRQHIILDDLYSPEDDRRILSAIKHAYENSASAKAMFDRLLTVESDVQIMEDDAFNATIETNILTIGMTYLNNLVFIDAHGKPARYSFEMALVHEFSHALNNLQDPTTAQLAAHDYVGDNVRFENTVRSELGIGARGSYFNVVTDAYYAANKSAFTTSKSYTNGNAVDLVVVAHDTFGYNIDTSSKGTSRDLLMGDGQTTNNILSSGDGRDYLYGVKGNDTLDGGAGTDYLFGGADDDILIGGSGSNLLDGGGGKDLAELTGFKFLQTVTVDGDKRIFVDGPSGAKNVLKNIENVRFTASDQPLPTQITASFVSSTGSTLAATDDGFVEASLTAAFDKGFNFFGTKYTSVYVNNNGNLTFGAGLSGYTPGTIGGNSGSPIIAAFWADADTRNGGGAVTYGYNSAHDSFVATWSNVDYFNRTSVGHVSRANSYQIEIFDQGAGDAEIIIRYGDLNWTTGDASGGSGGLGGSVARAGVNSGNAAFQYEMPGSGTQAAMLALDGTSNCGRAGVWRFSVHNGVIIDETTTRLSQDDFDWAFS